MSSPSVRCPLVCQHLLLIKFVQEMPPGQKNMKRALNLEVFNAIPIHRLQNSSRPREHGNIRSLGDGAKSQSSSAKTFRRRICSSAAEDAKSRIARPRSRKQESSRSFVDREEGKAVRKRRSSVLIRSCTSVADEESYRICRPRPRTQDNSRTKNLLEQSSDSRTTLKLYHHFRSIRYLQCFLTLHVSTKVTHLQCFLTLHVSTKVTHSPIMEVKMKSASKSPDTFRRSSTCFQETLDVAIAGLPTKTRIRNSF